MNIYEAYFKIEEVFGKNPQVEILFDPCANQFPVLVGKKLVLSVFYDKSIQKFETVILANGFIKVRPDIGYEPSKIHDHTQALVEEIQELLTLLF